MGFSVVSNVASANAQANMEMTQVGLNRATGAAVPRAVYLAVRQF